MIEAGRTLEHQGQGLQLRHGQSARKSPELMIHTGTSSISFELPMLDCCLFPIERRQASHPEYARTLVILGSHVIEKNPRLARDVPNVKGEAAQ